MDNTQLSHTCVMKEYLYYIMIQNQYHGCFQYPDSIYIPWPYLYTMSRYLYLESMSIPWVHVFSMSPCLYHESMCITWVLVNSIHLFLYHESLPITWVNVYNMSPEIQITITNFQKYRNKSYRKKEIQITNIHKYKLHKYRNKMT